MVVTPKKSRGSMPHPHPGAPQSHSYERGLHRGPPPPSKMDPSEGGQHAPHYGHHPYAPPGYHPHGGPVPPYAHHPHHPSQQPPYPPPSYYGGHPPPHAVGYYPHPRYGGYGHPSYPMPHPSQQQQQQGTSPSSSSNRGPQYKSPRNNVTPTSAAASEAKKSPTVQMKRKSPSKGDTTTTSPASSAANNKASPSTLKSSPTSKGGIGTPSSQPKMDRSPTNNSNMKLPTISKSSPTASSTTATNGNFIHQQPIKEQDDEFLSIQNVDPMRSDFHFYAMDEKDKYMEQSTIEAQVRFNLPKSGENKQDDNNESKLTESKSAAYYIMTCLNETLMKNWEVESTQVRSMYLKKEEEDRTRFMKEDDIASRHCATLTARSKSPKSLKAYYEDEEEDQEEEGKKQDQDDDEEEDAEDENNEDQVEKDAGETNIDPNDDGNTPQITQQPISGTKHDLDNIKENQTDKNENEEEEEVSESPLKKLKEQPTTLVNEEQVSLEEDEQLEVEEEDEDQKVEVEKVVVDNNEES